MSHASQYFPPLSQSEDKESEAWREWTKGVQDLAMSTDFNAHLITSRQPSEECKSKVLLNLEDVFPNYEANLTPDLFRL